MGELVLKINVLMFYLGLPKRMNVDILFWWKEHERIFLSATSASSASRETFLLLDLQFPNIEHSYSQGERPSREIKDK